MTFTDDDLSRLKKDYATFIKAKETCDLSDSGFEAHERLVKKLVALIARLEAAERWANLMWDMRNGNDRMVSLAEIEWHKAAGK